MSEQVKLDHIGLDMDGVLVDLQKYQLEKGKRYFRKKFGTLEDLNLNTAAYDIQDIFGCTKKERTSFWNKYIWEYALFFPARESADKMTHKWHKEGRTVDIITSRVYVTRNGMLGWLFRTMVKIWLHTQHIYYDRIKFCSEEGSAADKSKACQEYDIKLMVEDKTDNMEEISKKTTIACFDAYWNSGYEKENVYRVNSFYQIDNLIRELERGGRK
ncbi:MAG: hypothetical protein J1E35_03315 [Lachnospiraceae bacterium]|nr:hypothetical protein [Lachnospiraceae bacterium]